MQDDFRPFRPKAPEPAYAPVEVETQPVYDEQLSAETGPGDSLPPVTHDTPHTAPEPHKSPKGPKAWWRKFKRLPMKQRIIIVTLIVLMLLGGSAAAWFMLKPEPPPPPPQAPMIEEPPAPTVYHSPLTGMEVTEAQTKLPVTGVMIENSPDARPQSGLYEAGVVYEAIAEGGITRFLTLFQEAQPKELGPVRSVRPYYLDFLAPYDAPIAHAGGSGPALEQIRTQNFKDLDHGNTPHDTYQRVSHRYAPHNLYTSRAKLLAAQKARGWNTSKFTGFARKEEEKSSKPNAKRIDFTISGALYNVRYSYDAKTNSYKRFLGGTPHNDASAKKQISPKVVVALVMTHRYGGIYSVYGTTGKSTAYFFQDGTVVKGTWEKKNRKSQFIFKNAKGEEQKLNPGQTWITIVSSPNGVAYK